MTPLVGHPQIMLTKTYIEALLIDEELPDQVWAAWDAGEIDDPIASIAWILIAYVPGQLIQIEAIQPMPSCSFSLPVKFATKP